VDVAVICSDSIHLCTACKSKREEDLHHRRSQYTYCKQALTTPRDLTPPTPRLSAPILIESHLAGPRSCRSLTCLPHAESRNVRLGRFRFVILNSGLSADVVLPLFRGRLACLLDHGGSLGAIEEHTCLLRCSGVSMPSSTDQRVHLRERPLVSGKKK
jgi:hypothetical protein